jgi:iron-sulfur cluster assembly protein
VTAVAGPAAVTVGGVAVSARAFDEIARAAAKRATRPRGLRVGIRGGGCTGFSYFFEWSDAAPRPEDLVIARPDAPDGVPVLIDPKSKVFLAGSTLEYASTLMHRGFKWTNPNVKGSCGCGESVQF